MYIVFQCDNTLERGMHLLKEEEEEKADDLLCELPVWLKSVVQFPDWFRTDVSKKESLTVAITIKGIV